MVARHPLNALTWVALALAAAPAAAGGAGEAAPGEGSAADDHLEWTALDREIAALAQTTPEAATPDGIRVDAVLRTNYAWFDESPTPAVDDYSGFALDNVRPRINGTIGDYSFQIEVEAQSGTAARRGKA